MKLRGIDCKMGEGLETLKVVKWKLEDEGILGKEYELCDIIEKELKAKEVQDKAFEIMITKRVQLDTLFSIFTHHKEKENSAQLNLYNSCVGFPERKLTQEEYDFLKEVLTREELER